MSFLHFLVRRTVRFKGVGSGRGSGQVPGPLQAFVLRAVFLCKINLGIHSINFFPLNIKYRSDHSPKMVNEITNTQISIPGT